MYCDTIFLVVRPLPEMVRATQRGGLGFSRSFRPHPQVCVFIENATFFTDTAKVYIYTMKTMTENAILQSRFLKTMVNTVVYFCGRLKTELNLALLLLVFDIL